MENNPDSPLHFPRRCVCTSWTNFRKRYYFVQSKSLKLFESLTIAAEGTRKRIHSSADTAGADDDERLLKINARPSAPSPRTRSPQKRIFGNARL